MHLVFFQCVFSISQKDLLLKEVEVSKLLSRISNSFASIKLTASPNVMFFTSTFLELMKEIDDTWQ